MLFLLLTLVTNLVDHVFTSISTQKRAVDLILFILRISPFPPFTTDAALVTLFPFEVHKLSQMQGSLTRGWSLYWC